MNDAVRDRLVTILAAGIAYLISQQVVDRLIDIPEEPGLKDDVIEAILKGATTATSTILASIVVRRLLKG
jgi:energy-converting hydrogenase Eha subunit B